MSNENAVNQGRNDASTGKGPANNPNWTHQEREKYNASYDAQKKSGGQKT